MGLRSCGMRCRRLVASRYAAINRQHSSFLFHFGLSALLALTLTACGGGGGTDATAQDTTTQEAAAQESASARSETAQATGTESWTLCAAEGQTCTVPATTQVRYGIDGKYLYKTVTGSIACTNALWSDPAVGNVKHCDYVSATTTAAAPSSGWAQVAGEGQSFSLASAQTVRYGTGTSWVTRTVSGAGFCANWYFGSDPAPGQVKRCEVQSSGSTTPTTASGWTYLANENQPISLASASMVRYGVGSLWVQRTIGGGGSCSNWFFGTDPAPNQLKHCEVLSTTSGTTTAPTPAAPAPAPAPTATAGSALLQWDAAGGNVAGYRVYWGTSPGNYQQAKGSGIGAGSATSYTVQNLPAGKTYYFAVTAYDGSGAESGYSTEASKTIQ